MVPTLILVYAALGNTIDASTWAPPTLPAHNPPDNEISASESFFTSEPAATDMKETLQASQPSPIAAPSNIFLQPLPQRRSFSRPLSETYATRPPRPTLVIDISDSSRPLAEKQRRQYRSWSQPSFSSSTGRDWDGS